MTRPHEDLRHHTPTDHRPGGPALALSPGSWWAITVAHVAAERAPAGVAAYETLVEQARIAAPKAREAAVLESHDRRRVIAMLHLDGHEAFRHLTAAWDDHHMFAERHAVAESQSLALYRLVTNVGESTIDPASTDAYAFERVSSGTERTGPISAAISAAPGFRGAMLFGADGADASAVFYRFSHADEIETFRATPEAKHVLGPSGAPGETFYAVRLVRTFA
jgi:hypothetical protein